ncbi:MAG TPA: TetR/AcrR family transcriptional regulator [Sphaerochaeta sp.]|jgi:AcrR family transcriptional regulator|nr:TetR/AcrR family transcriptional regulator [Sphaerochaeta sp.]HPZ15072.1 TetR/AcrR family transcriptional regulator [Sphaerochaeta sp.]
MTRERIITTLLTLASQRGLSNVSLSLLASECSITKAALFHHFESRDALERELFTFATDLAQTQMATIPLTGSATDVLFAAMDHWHGLYAQEPLRSFYRIIEAEALHRSEAMRIKRSLSQMIKAQSRAVLESLSSTGRLAIGDVEFAILTLSTGAEHFLTRLLSEDEETIAWEEEQFITSFARLYDPGYIEAR